jgi:hypothetical protein
MKENKLNFESENLVVDYLTFNIESKDPERLQKIADYLSENFQCNSFLIDVQDSTKNRVLSKKSKNYCKAEFRTNYTKYWPGTIIGFSGNHARFFYETIKDKQLNKDIFDFDNTNLGRIDLCYDRKIQQSDYVQTLDSFLKNSCTKINSKVDTSKAEVVKGVFRVGKRSSPNYFRVYPKSNGKFFRFELELKKSAIKRFQSYFFLHQFEKWEELLTCHFYKEAMNKLDLDSPYTDWLIENSRKIRSIELSGNCLLTTYIKNISFDELENQEFFYRLFQLLSYIKILESSVNWISNESYRIISFRVSDFLEFTGKEKTNYYQIRKLVGFLESLQSLPPIRQYFSDGGFRSALIFPYLEVRRKKSWCVELAISERLYFYQYPFSFPKNFLICDQKYQLRVQLFFLKSFSISNLKKEFQIEKFFDTFSISNSKTKDLRNYMIELFGSLESSKRIEPGFEILLKTNQRKKVDKLTLKLISGAKSIFCTEMLPVGK